MSLEATEQPFAKIEPILSSWKSLDWGNHLFELISGIDQMVKTNSQFGQIELLLRKLILHSAPLEKFQLGNFEWIRPEDLFCKENGVFILGEEDGPLSVGKLYEKLVNRAEDEASQQIGESVEEKKEELKGKVECDCFRCLVSKGSTGDQLNWVIVRVCILHEAGFFVNMSKECDDGISCKTILELLDSFDDGSAKVELAWSKIEQIIGVLDKEEWTRDEYSFVVLNNESVDLLEKYSKEEFKSSRACILLGLLKKQGLQKYKSMPPEDNYKERCNIFALFEKAADYGSNTGMYLASKELSNFDDDVREKLNLVEREIYWLNLAAEKQSIYALHDLATFHLNGGKKIEKFVSVDSLKGVEVLKQAARLGSMDSFVLLSDVYKDGKGKVCKYYPDKIKWEIQGALFGNPECQFRFAKSLEELVGGDIFQGNVVSAALKWSERAAEQGHVEAQLFTGMIYLKLADSLTETDQADGKSRLQKEGLRWIESAANGNVVAAQLRLGYVYMSGLHGAERDPKLCLKWIKAAANHGNARAIYLYSQLYQTLADEVSLSAIVEKTEELLLKAAEKGCAEAQFALGQKRLSVVLQNFEDDYQKALVAAHQSGDFEKSELWQAVSLIQKAARTSAKYPKAAFTMAHLLLDESRIYGEEEPQIECIAEAAQYLEKVILWEKSEETRTYAKQLLTSLTQQDQVRKRFIDQKIMFSYIKSRFGIKS